MIKLRSEGARDNPPVALLRRTTSNATRVFFFRCDDDVRFITAAARGQEPLLFYFSSRFLSPLMFYYFFLFRNRLIFQTRAPANLYIVKETCENACDFGFLRFPPVTRPVLLRRASCQRGRVSGVKQFSAAQKNGKNNNIKCTKRSYSRGFVANENHQKQKRLIRNQIVYYTKPKPGGKSNENVQRLVVDKLLFFNYSELQRKKKKQ